MIFISTDGVESEFGTAVVRAPVGSIAREEGLGEQVVVVTIMIIVCVCGLFIEVYVCINYWDICSVICRILIKLSGLLVVLIFIIQHINLQQYQIISVYLKKFLRQELVYI